MVVFGKLATPITGTKVIQFDSIRVSAKADIPNCFTLVYFYNTVGFGGYIFSKSASVFMVILRNQIVS